MDFCALRVYDGWQRQAPQTLLAAATRCLTFTGLVISTLLGQLSVLEGRTCAGSGPAVDRWVDLWSYRTRQRVPVAESIEASAGLRKEGANAREFGRSTGGSSGRFS